jgi:predicted permease
MPEWKASIRERLRSLRLAPEREAEIVDEIAQHLEDRHREMRARGLEERAAETAVWRELEEEDVLARGLTMSERSRLADLPPPGAPERGRWLAALWQDIRYSVRSLRQQPTFAFTVLLALALTIGPTTAIVSVTNWMFWRPLPGVTNPDEMSVVWFGSWSSAESFSVSRISYSNLADLSAGLTTAAGLAGVQEVRGNLAVADGLPRMIGVSYVTHDFFRVLGLAISPGRTFQPEEDRGAYGAPVVIVSRRFAEHHFGSAAGALDAPLVLNRKPFRVIGVVASDFRGTRTISDIDAWITGATSSYLNDAPGADLLSSRTYRSPFYQFVARVAPNATHAQMQAELHAQVRRLADVHPDVNAQYRETSAHVFPGLNLEPLARSTTWMTGQILLGIAGLLLALGCANAANMFIARAIRRRAEIGVRRALGATGARLAQLQLVESCGLAFIGAALGVAVALVLKEMMQHWLFPETAGTIDPIPIDLRVLSVTAGAAVSVGVLSGLASAWLATRADIEGGYVRAGSRTATRAPRLRSALAVAQLSLSLALLVGALLLVGTLRHLRSVELGFDPTHATVFRPRFTGVLSSPEKILAYDRALMEALATSFPRAATIASNGPVDVFNTSRVLSGGDGSVSSIELRTRGVAGNYFEVMKTPFVAGRTFTADESFVTAPLEMTPIVINETFARRFFGAGDPLGRLVHRARYRQPAVALSVIGVVRDSRASDLTREPEPVAYFPLGRNDVGVNQAAIVVRSSRPLVDVIREVQSAAARVNRDVPLWEPERVLDAIDRTIRVERLFAGVFGWMSVIAFLLAAIGLHGLVAQVTQERAREFGIRLAIGATRASIARLVARYVLTISASGVAIGLGLAWLGTPFVKSMLFGVTELDPIIYLTAVCLLAVIVGIASAWPAFRATRVQPVDILRAE